MYMSIANSFNSIVLSLLLSVYYELMHINFNSCEQDIQNLLLSQHCNS